MSQLSAKSMLAKIRPSAKVYLGVLMFAVFPSVALANYTVKITNPSEDRAYVRPAETIEIGLMVEPKLNPLDTLVLSIDGQFLTANQVSYNFHSLDYNPGEHTIKAQVQDETGKTIASDVRTIYLIQNTQLMQDNAAKAQAQANYDAMSWYKKMLSKLVQEDKSTQKIKKAE